MSSRRELLTPRDIAEMDGVCLDTVYLWLRTGRLKAVRNMRNWRIRPQDHAAMWEQRKRTVEAY